MPDSYIATDENLLDMRRHEHIVVACGVLPEHVSADADGWLLNDFFFLAHSLHSTERKGTFIWLTCIPPGILIECYALFAVEYGITSPLPSYVRICDKEEIVDIFLEATKGACRKAQNAKYLPRNSAKKNEGADDSEEEVLVILLGHGEITLRGIEIGRQKNPLNNPEPTAEEYIAQNGLHVVWQPERRVTAEMIDRIAVAHPEAIVSAMCPAYFVGRWEYLVDFGFRADRNKYVQIDRRTGAIFSYGIARSKLEWDTELKDQQKATSLVRASLLGLYTDSQVIGGPSAGGLPSEENVVINSDSFDRLLVSSSLLDRVGGSQMALHRLLRLQSQAYLRSFPGWAIERQALEESIKVCLLGDPEEDDLEALAIYMHHQTSFSKLAMNLIKVMKLGPFQRIDKWSYVRWVVQHGFVPIWVLNEFVLWIATYWPVEFPSDTADFWWVKPIIYLAAAVVQRGLTEDEMKERLELGGECESRFFFTEFFERCLLMLFRIQICRRKRQEWKGLRSRR
jgi:hypothetical protein